METKQPTRSSVKVGSDSWTVKKRADHYYLECTLHYTEGVAAQLRVRTYGEQLAEINRNRKTVQISYENMLGYDDVAAAEQKLKLDAYEADEKAIRELMEPWKKDADDYEATVKEFQTKGYTKIFPNHRFAICGFCVPRPGEFDVTCQMKWRRKNENEEALVV